MPRERANERSCDAAIKKTLTYRAVFKYPLSYYQLYSTLVTNKEYKKHFFDKELNKMVRKGYIGYRNGKYFDKRIKPVSWDLRFKQSQSSIQKAKLISKILNNIPWIKMLAVTGSAAAFNSDKEGDIDFFIIAQTHRLWLTRGFVTILLKVMGIYAQDGDRTGKVCPNLFIDEVGMTWPEEQRSIFTAHEIILMQPLIDRENTYFKFLQANDWIKEYFATFPILNRDQIKNRESKAGRVINILEKIAAKKQLDYMSKKRTNEVIDKHLIHFKKNDNTSWIIDSYNELSNY